MSSNSKGKNDVEITATTAGFDLLEITLKKFMSYEKESTIKFNKSSLVITGPTGSGKTSILDGITFALYGRTTRTDRRASIKDICRENGHVELLFSTGAEQIVIRRGVLKKGSKSYLELKRDGQRITGKIAELNKQIIQLVGLGYDAFVSASFIRQDEMKLLGSRTDIERLTTLQKLFRLDVFNYTSDILKEERKIKEKGKTAVESRIEEKKTAIQKVPGLESDIHKYESDVKELKEQKANLKNEIIKLLEKVQQLEIFKEEHVEIKTKIAKDHQRQNKLVEDMQRIRTRQNDREKLQIEVKELEEKVKDIDTLQLEKTELEKKQLEFTHINQRYQDKKRELERAKSKHDQQMTKFDRDIHEQGVRINSLSNTIDQQQAFELLRKEGRLLERIDRINKEVIWLKEFPDIIESIVEEKKATKDELDEVSTVTGSITKDSFVLSEIKDRIKEYEDQKQDLVLQQEKDSNIILGDLKKFDVEKTRLQFGSEEVQRLVKLSQSIELLTVERNTLERKKLDLSSMLDQESLLEILKQQIRELVKINRLNIPKEENLRVKAEEFTTEKKRLDQLNQQMLELEKTLSGKEATIERMKIEKQQLEAEKQKVRQLQNDLDKLNREIKVQTILIEEVFHQKGVPFFAVNKLLPRIGKKASIILASITDDRYNNVVLEKTTGTKRVGFEIKVDTPQGYRDVSTFSGGERTQINAAVRIAISEELAQLGGGKSAIGFKTLFIDEGDLGSLDTAKSQQLFIQKLFSLTEKFNKIILVTHLGEITEQFENRLQISIDNKGHSIIVKT
ncbi:MAG: AAA family ATPase [Candidatus Hodarchaeales archaeon]|jgi:exonuclease SbcC